jgi:hypothetical protein
MNAACPHCHKPLKVPNRAFHNADAYNQTCHVTTECCYKMIKIVPRRSYSISVDDTNKEEDDWGVPTGEAGKHAYQALDEKITQECSKFHKP